MMIRIPSHSDNRYKRADMMIRISSHADNRNKRADMISPRADKRDKRAGMMIRTPHVLIIEIKGLT